MVSSEKLFRNWFKNKNIKDVDLEGQTFFMMISNM